MHAPARARTRAGPMVLAANAPIFFLMHNGSSGHRTSPAPLALSLSGNATLPSKVST